MKGSGFKDKQQLKYGIDNRAIIINNCFKKIQILIASHSLNTNNILLACSDGRERAGSVRFLGGFPTLNILCRLYNTRGMEEKLNISDLKVFFRFI